MIYNVKKLMFCAFWGDGMEIKSCGYDYRHSAAFKIKRPYGSGDYVLLILRSPAYVILKNKKHFTEGNAVIIFNKGTPQLFGAANCEFINDWVHFECDNTDILHLKELGIEFDTILQLQNVNALSSLQKYLCFEKHSNNKNSSQSTAMYFNLIMLKISDMCEQKKVKNTAIYEELLTLRNDIFSYPQKNWSIEEVSKKLAISKSYLQHLYKMFFNTCIIKDITLSRIEHSKYLLFSTNYTICSISELCGYKNDVHFMRTFKRETGFTPTEYRKNLNSHVLK